MTRQNEFDFDDAPQASEPQLEPRTIPHNHVATSKAAAESVREVAGGDAKRVYAALKERGGLTCAEVETLLGLSHQTASARLNGLRRNRAIYDSGLTRMTPSRRQAIVWKACK